MTDDDNNINEFSPENVNNSIPDEYNPYQDFLNENTDDIPGDQVSFTPSIEENGSQNELTTENDIELPDFLKTGVELEQFKNTVEETPVMSESTFQHPSGKKKELNDSELSTEIHSEQPEETDNPSFPETQQKDNILSSTSDNYENNTDEPGINNEISENVNQNEIRNTEDKEDDIKYKPKVSAEDADKKPGGKPKVLNKKFLLTAVVSVLGIMFLVVFLMPAKRGKKSKNEKPVASTPVSKNYQSMANKQTVDVYDAEETGHYESSVSDEPVEIPPLIIEDKQIKQESISYSTGTGTSTSSSSAVTIPDTRNDSLHGKTISGIKGLTSTQASYSTDYQQTIAKNTSGSSSSNLSALSKEDYVNSLLSSYSSSLNGGNAYNSTYTQQNDQAGKNSFFNNGRNGTGVGQGQYLNLNTLWQGTIFEAILTSELNTDLPGEITARIAKNIYSSQDGRYLLIPQNSIVYGTYNSSISYSQSRVQVAWHTLVRPDGYQIQLGNMNGTDSKGASGLQGIVNDHPLAYLKAVGLMSVFSIVNSEFQSSMGETDNQYVQNILANSQAVTNELADKLIDRAMNVQPTIKIKSGTKINIVVNQNLSLPPYEDFPVTQAYHRE